MHLKSKATPTEVTLTEANGIRNLHFGTHFIQGAMRLENPRALEFEYIQQMMMWTLFTSTPRHIAQLGLGAASLTKFCHCYFPLSQITAVELSPEVIECCRQHFYLPRDNARLKVLALDAMDFVIKPEQHSTIDILQVDLYDAHAQKPALDSVEFYQGCANCLTADGIMTVNLFCDAPDHRKNLEIIEQCFEAVAWLPEVHDGNIVAIAFKQAPSVDFEVLDAKAKEVTTKLGLPAQDWVDGLRAWMLPND